MTTWDGRQNSPIGPQGEQGPSSGPHFRCNQGDLPKGNRVCGICRSAQGRSALEPRACHYLKAAFGSLKDVEIQTTQAQFALPIASSAHMDFCNRIERGWLTQRNLRPAVSQVRPPRHPLALVPCPFKFNVTSRYPAPGASSSRVSCLPQVHRKAGAKSSSAAFKQVARHPRSWLPSLSGRRSPLPEHRVSLSICCSRALASPVQHQLLQLPSTARPRQSLAILT